MSDPGLDASVTLDISAALAAADSIADALSVAVTDLPVTADATEITSAVDAAIAAAETEVTVEGDAAPVTSAVDDAIAAADPTVTVDADTAGVQADLDSLNAEVDVTADTAAAVAEIEGIDDNVPDVEIAVVADTSEAQSAIEELGDTSAESVTQVGSLSQGMEGLSVAQGGAIASADGLASSLGVIIGKAGPLGAGIAGVTATIGGFFAAGLEAEQVAQRFDRTLGNLASSVRQINVGTLSGDVSDLAVALGTSDEKLLDAATRIAQFGDNAGAAADEAARTAEQILALSLRTRALNPDLGEAGDIADRLVTALARGGRALAPFNIALSASDIQARALADNIGKTAAELTIYDKAAAGAALATEQLGASFAEDFAAGLNDPKIQLAALREEFGETIEAFGQPLVAPILDVLTALQPIAVSVAESMGAAVDTAVPLLEVIGSLGPVFEATGFIISNFVKVALFPLTSAISAVRAVSDHLFGPSDSERFSAEVKEVTDALTDAEGQLELTGEAVARYIEATSRFESQNQLDDLDRLGLSLEQVGKFALEGAEGKRKFDAAIRSGDESDNNIGDLEHSFADLVERLQGAAKNALLTGVALTELDGEFLAAGEATGDYVTALRDAQAAQDVQAQSALNAAVAAGTLTVAQRDLLLAAVTSKDGIVDYSAALESFEAQQDAAAGRTKQFATDFADLASTLPTVAAAYAGLSDGIGSTAGNLAVLALALGDATVGTEELTVIATGLGVPVESLQAFVDAANESISAFVSTAVEQLPSVGSAFDDAAAAAEEASVPLSGTAILDALTKTVTDIQSVSATMREAIAAGYGDVAAFALNEGGPAALAAIGQSLQDKDFATLEGIRTAFATGIPVAFADLVALLGPAAAQVLVETGVIGTQMGETLGTNFNPDTIIVGELGAATAAVPGAGSPLIDAVRQTGTTAHEQYGTEVAQIPGTTTEALDGATTAVNNAQGGLFAAALALGSGTGDEFGSGLKPSAEAGAKEGTDAAGAAVVSGGLFIKIRAMSAGQGVGESFGSGIVQGIDSYIPRIKAAAAKAVNDAERAARDAADSDSPSKLFAALGLDLSKGIALGISDGTPQVVKEAEAIVRDAAAAAQAAATEARTLATADLIAATDTGRVRTPTLAVRQLDVSAIDGAVGGSMTVQVGDVVVEFHGALPTDAQARAAGEQVADGMEKRLRERRLVVQARGL